MPAEPKSPADGLTPGRFEWELEGLAVKARHDARSRSTTGRLVMLLEVGFLLTLLAIYSIVSPLSLSPVYGSIPSSIWHPQLLMAGCFAGWAGNMALPRLLPMGMGTAQALPLVALSVPALQSLACRYSNLLGPLWGPVVTETLILLPLAVLTSAVVADYLDGARLPLVPAFVADAAPGLGSWGWLKLVEHAAAKQLQANMGRALVFSRLGLQLALGLAYAVFSRSKFLILALPPLLHTLLLNTHLPSLAATSSLVSSLMSDNWLLLDRRESLTGYASVVQSLQDGYRAMFCDHSLLGGNCIESSAKLLPEPIYGVFAMLEALLLAEKELPVPDEDAHVLVIGLGVGTLPSALVTHGVNTSVVEIDSVVHDFAVKYFGLKENNPPVLEDPVGYTSRLAATAPESYDYIVHDVFTGGAEPVDLFTLEFLQGLATLLKPDGVIAINYAGDLALPAPKLIYRTIAHVFLTCRIFRESPRDAKAFEERGLDFTNMVIFCRKSRSPLTFRLPTEADSLGSTTRKRFLRLRHEVPQADLFSGDDASLVRSNDTSALVKWYKQSAQGHWFLMRTVMPSFVWERW